MSKQVINWVFSNIDLTDYDQKSCADTQQKVDREDDKRLVSEASVG